MTSWFEEAQKQYAQKWADVVKEILLHEMEDIKSKEENTMMVSYKGVTGELEKMERLRYGVPISTTDSDGRKHPGFYYTLEIWDPDKKCKVSFANVPLNDVKFLGGEVSYG